MKIGFVLIPGGGMSDWLWVRLLPHLNYPAVSISSRLLINDRESRLHAPFSSLVEHAAEVALGAAFDAVVLVGHSGAGLIAGALARVMETVVHVVFVAANIPKSGGTAIDALPEELREMNAAAIEKQAEHDAIPISSFGEAFLDVFCNTCSEEDRRYVLSRDFHPGPLCVLSQRMDWGDYPDVGMTYITCSQDRTLTLEGQRAMASNLSIADIRNIESDHLVMISHPIELAAQLNGIVAAY